MPALLCYVINLFKKTVSSYCCACTVLFFTSGYILKLALHCCYLCIPCLLAITVVSRKYTAHPLLQPCTKRRGGLIRGMRHFLSLDYALPSGARNWVKHDLIVGGGWGPSARRRDVPDASGRLTSFSVEGRGNRALPRSSWRVHR